MAGHPAILITCSSSPPISLYWLITNWRFCLESKCGSWVLSFGHWQCLRCILGYIWGTIPSVRCLPVLLLGFFLVGCGFGWFIVRLDGVFRRLKKVRLGGCFISKILHIFPIFWSLSMKMQEVQEGIHRTNAQTDDWSNSSSQVCFCFYLSLQSYFGGIFEEKFGLNFNSFFFKSWGYNVIFLVLQLHIWSYVFLLIDVYNKSSTKVYSHNSCWLVFNLFVDTSHKIWIILTFTSIYSMLTTNYENSYLLLTRLFPFCVVERISWKFD